MKSHDDWKRDNLDEEKQVFKETHADTRENRVQMAIIERLKVLLPHVQLDKDKNTFVWNGPVTQFRDLSVFVEGWHENMSEAAEIELGLREDFLEKLGYEGGFYEIKLDPEEDWEETFKTGNTYYILEM